MTNSKRTRISLRKPPEGQGNLIPVQLRLEPELVRDVDRKIDETNRARVVKLSRTVVIRLLMNGWLKGQIDIDALPK
jgi:hypothetical protein